MPGLKFLLISIASVFAAGIFSCIGIWPEGHRLGAQVAWTYSRRGRFLGRIWQPFTYIFLHSIERPAAHYSEYVCAVEFRPHAGAGVGNAAIPELFFYLRQLARGW